MGRPLRSDWHRVIWLWWMSLMEYPGCFAAYLGQEVGEKLLLLSPEFSPDYYYEAR